jgi:trigger factor
LEGIPLKVDIQDVSSCKKTLKIEIPAEDVSAEFEVAYEEVRTTIPVPGFRKGRAPRSILRMRFGEYVKGEVIEKLIPSAFEGAIGDADLEILRPLDLTDMNPPIDEISVKDGEPLIFEITVDVKPEIPVPNLTLLEVEKGDVNVTKEDVDEYIQQLREERADFIPVEDRPVQEGDYVTLIISATSDGDALEQFDDEQVLKIGKDMEIPELAEYILGMKPDEEKEFSISFPPDYQGENESGWQHSALAGKEVNFQVKLSMISVRDLPPLDDDFAKDLGADDLQHLHASIWNTLVELRRQTQRSNQESDLMDQLLEKSQFEVPEFLVEERVKVLLRMARQEPGASKTEPTEEELSQYRSTILNTIKRIWILEEIAKNEEVDVSDEEIDAEVEKIATARGRDPQKYRKLMEDTNRIDGIRSAIWENKILDLLIEKASTKRTLIT